MFEIYLILQLDSVRIALSLIAGSLFVITCSAARSFSDETGRFIPNQDDVKRAAKRFYRCAGVLVATVLLTALVPSTRTAAAMFVIPYLTSEEFVVPASAEVREIIDIAKEALRASVEQEKETSSK